MRALLRNVRSDAIDGEKILVCRFFGKRISITDENTGKVIAELDVPTLDQVNYDTTLGDDMIVFYKRGTAEYNKRIHGGDIRLKSWLGFRKNIAVNCTGLVAEAVYPAEKGD